MKKKKGQEEAGLSQALGGTLNILGLSLDLGKLLSSPEDVKGQLGGLRARLQELGGKEVLSDEEWGRGEAMVSGHVRVRGMAGEREYHIGTSGSRRPPAKPEVAPEPPEVLEPSLDLFDEPHLVTIVADVPGIGLGDLDLKVKGGRLTISTKPGAARAYKKTVRVGTEVEAGSLEASCRNGVLEIRLKKAKEGAAQAREGDAS